MCRMKTRIAYYTFDISSPANNFRAIFHTTREKNENEIISLFIFKLPVYLYAFVYVCVCVYAQLLHVDAVVSRADE